MGSRLILVALSTLVACSTGDGAIGERCDGPGDCRSSLQCLESTCVPRCQRAPDCGDGYRCDETGICRLAAGRQGEVCASEVECGPGLACRIDGPDAADPSRLVASCAEPESGRPPSAACATDNECRDGTCALGRCVDLCASNRDCPTTDSCQTIPRGQLSGSGDVPMLVETSFRGCIPARGNLVFTIPVTSVDEDVLLPVPSNAQQASLVIAIDDATQRAGIMHLSAPSGQELFKLTPCGTSVCDPENALAEFYSNLVRHEPMLGQSVVAIPSRPDVPLETGDYVVHVSSLRQGGTLGSEIPRVTAVLRLATAVLLDLHFHFLDLTDHPCQDSTGGIALSAATAQVEPYFQSDYLPQIRSIFARAGITIGQLTYDDLPGHPELDELAVSDTGALLALGEYATGINVFFVRSITPSVTQILGPSPGPGGIAHTRQSGIAIGLDTVCYRSWATVARLTSHELARYMGLYNTIDFEVVNRNIEYFSDPIPDTSTSLDDTTNLMFFSELGGTQLTVQQRELLLRSPVLR